MVRKKIVVAVSGASGMPYALKVLEILKAARTYVSLIISEAAKGIADDELDNGSRSLSRLASETLDNGDMGAWPASGSRRFDALVVVPCSMATMGKIAHGISDNLIA